MTKAAKPDAPGTALVPHDKPPAASPPADFGPPALSEAAAAFLAGIEDDRQAPKTVPVVGIDHRAGGFVLPSGEVVSEVSGYPLYYFGTKKFYLKPPQAGQKGQPPDCWSADLVVPHPTVPHKQAPACAQCPMNEFGSGRDGKSKACADMTWVFLVNPAFGVPPLAAVVAPPSSIRALLGTRFKSGYFAQAAARHQAYEIVWTTFRLTPMGDPRGVQYCVLDPVMGPPADLKQALALRKYRDEFKAAMDALRLKTPDTQAQEPDA